MPELLRGGALVGAGLILASFSPIATVSSAALATLDPVRLASALCGGRAEAAGLNRVLAIASAAAGPVSASAEAMPLYPDLATLRLPVSTSSEQARLYFNQGLLLTYGFNHA